MRHSALRGFGLAIFVACAFEAVPALAQERYAASSDGQEVTDNTIGLIWRRCAKGMSWKVKPCVGQPVFANHALASAGAKAATSAAKDWRLPTLKELSSGIAMRQALEGKAAINPGAFPATPLARFWTFTSWGRVTSCSLDLSKAAWARANAIRPAQAAWSETESKPRRFFQRFIQPRPAAPVCRNCRH